MPLSLSASFNLLTGFFSSLSAVIIGIRMSYLTLYAFSTENWKRPEDDVNKIMELLDQMIEEAIEDFRQGKFLIVVDDEDRENEGDFVVAAELITEEQISNDITDKRILSLYERRIPVLSLEPYIMPKRGMAERLIALIMAVAKVEILLTAVNTDNARTPFLNPLTMMLFTTPDTTPSARLLPDEGSPRKTNPVRVASLMSLKRNFMERLCFLNVQ